MRRPGFSLPPPAARGGFRPLPTGAPGSPRANVFILTISIGVGLFLAIEPTQQWLLLLLTGLTALGMSALLRTEGPVHIDVAGERFRTAPDAAATVFSFVVPVLWVFGAGLLAEYISVGYWSLLAALGVGVGFGVIVYAEIDSLDKETEAYQVARFTLNVAAYVIVLALFAAPYALDLGRVSSALFIVIAAVLMTVELMREAPMSPLQVLIMALTSGFLLAETRWALYYLPLADFLSATLLLLQFYVTTGVLQTALLSRFTTAIMVEYLTVGGTVLLIIVAAEVMF